MVYSFSLLNSILGVQVILRWSVQQNIIVIPKSTNEGRLKQNLDVFDFDLTAEEMETMKTYEF